MAPPATVGQGFTKERIIGIGFNTQERTEWHRIKLFGKLGDIAGEYLRKGSQCYIEGRIRYDKFTGQDGQERYTTEIAAEKMQMSGYRGEGSNGSSSGTFGNHGARAHSSARQLSEKAAYKTATEDPFVEDGMPFGGEEDGKGTPTQMVGAYQKVF